MGLRAHKVRVAVIAIMVAFGVAATGASAAGPAASGVVAVHTSKQATAIGKVLVSATGRTLYRTSSNKTNIVRCIGGCAAKWPALLIGATVKPIAGPGVVASLLGSVKRPDGKFQVTYRGMALYLFSGDKKTGDVKGQGTGGTWHAIAPSGSVVTKAAKAPAATAPAKKPGSGSGTPAPGSGSGTPAPGSGSGTPAPGGGTSVNCDANPAADGCGM